MPSFEAGTFEGARLLISQQVGRYDITLSPDPANSKSGEYLHIGDLQMAIETVIKVVHGPFKPEAAATRLAMGATLLRPVASAEDGYKLLKAMLPVARDLPEEATDFFYQVNIPISVRVSNLGADLRINRLLRWFVGILQRLDTIGGSGVPTQLVASSVGPVVRLEMDINTPPDLSMPLTRDTILEVVDCLAAQASAIAKVGGFPR